MGYNGAGKDVWLLCVLMMAWSLLASCGNGEKESDEIGANDALLSKWEIMSQAGSCWLRSIPKMPQNMGSK